MQVQSSWGTREFDWPKSAYHTYAKHEMLLYKGLHCYVLCRFICDLLVTTMATKQSELELEFFEAVPKELTCCICMKLLREPHLMNCCEQQFCKGCLEDWLGTKKACPHCRSRNYTHVLMQQTNRKSRELKVYCPNKQHGCTSTLKISECEQHLSTGCLYAKLKCPNGCSDEIIRKDMKTHAEMECPRRPACCSFCNIQGEYQIIMGRHKMVCPLYPLPCPRGCNDTVLRRNLVTHRETCPLEPVFCPFGEFGCESKVCRKDLAQHMEGSVLQHLADLAKSHSILKAEHTKLGREHASLKEDCSHAKRAYSEKVKAIEPIVKTIPYDSNCCQMAQICTIMVDTSTLTLGESATLVLSDSNQESGRHYITLSLGESLPNIKFRAEWKVKKMASRYRKREYFGIKIFCTHSSTNSFTENLKFTATLDGASRDCVCSPPQACSDEKLLGTLSLTRRSEKSKVLTMCFALSRNESDLEEEY